MAERAAQKTYVYAAGALGPNGSTTHDYSAPGSARLRADPGPISLRALAKEIGVQLPRLISRFIELAVIGAHLCLRGRAQSPQDETALYVATGLGDIARTDELYFQVMPPSSEMPSPARFATSLNTMAAFFAAQRAGATARNLTISADELSFEAALALAQSDLAAGIATNALVGGLDEIVAPRHVYLRRFALDEGAHSGEGSAWLLIGGRPDGALGEIIGVANYFPTGAVPWAEEVASSVARWGLSSAGLKLMPGCRLSTDELAALSAVFAGSEPYSYLDHTGCFPTAAGLALVSAFEHAWSETTHFLHVNRDRAGRTGLIALRSYPQSQ